MHQLPVVTRCVLAINDGPRSASLEDLEQSEEDSRRDEIVNLKRRLMGSEG